MSDCCENKSCAIDALKERQSATLKIVLAINAIMFVVELAAGLLWKHRGEDINMNSVFLGYGVSLVLFILALRHLGSARTASHFSTAPFIGAGGPGGSVPIRAA